MKHFQYVLPLLFASTGCLPDDARPTPGHGRVTIAADRALRSGFVSDDDWEISYQTFLLSVGEVQLDGDDCSPYSESDYLRIVDLQRAGAQKLTSLYALGTCEFEFETSSPSQTAVLGAGVTEALRSELRTLESDAYVEKSGVVMRVVGSATRGSEARRFAWSFRRELVYSECDLVRFSSGGDTKVQLRASGTALFRSAPDAETPVLFEPYAAAAASNGEITLEALEHQRLDDDARFSTLGERLYLGLVPDVVRLPGCVAAEP